MVKGNFQHIVRLPQGIDENEFLASNTFDFYNNLAMFHATVAEVCTPRDCPSMSTDPAQFPDFTWTDAQKRAVKLPAAQYIDYVLAWCQNSLDDPTLFPTKANQDFPKDFIQTVSQIHRQLYRVFAHVYWAHFDTMLNLKQEGHWNSLFAHWVAFNREFDLVKREEMKEMEDLIQAWEQSGRFG